MVQLNAHGALGLHGNGLGAVLAIVAAIVSNVGTNMQKSSHNAASQAGTALGKFWRRPLWWAGMLLVIAGSVGDFWALGVASQTIVASLGGGTTLFVNVLIARYWNKEPLFLTDVIGCAAITCGAITLAVCGATSSPPKMYDLAMIKTRFERPAFILYMCCAMGLVMSLTATIAHSTAVRWRARVCDRTCLVHLFAWRVSADAVTRSVPGKLGERVPLRGGRTPAELTGLGEQAPISYKSFGTLDGGEKTRDDSARFGVEGSNSTAHWSDCYAYAACSGVAGSFTVLFSGCVAKLVVRTWHGQNQFGMRPFPYLLTALVAASVVLQVHLLNMGLQMGDIMGVFPVRTVEY